MAREPLSTKLARESMVEAQAELKRARAQVEFLGNALSAKVERYHALRVAHGDCNAATGFSAMQQEIEAINRNLAAIAQASIPE